MIEIYIYYNYLSEKPQFIITEGDRVIYKDSEAGARIVTYTGTSGEVLYEGYDPSIQELEEAFKALGHEVLIREAL